MKTWLQKADTYILRTPLAIRRGVALVVVAIIVVVVVLIIRGTRNALPHALVLTSTAFANGQAIPAKYTCDAENINPSYAFFHLPEGTKSLALYMEDTSIPAHPVHWMIWNVPSEFSTIMEGIRPAGTVARSFSGNFGYSGPCPDPGATHTYVTHLYALKTAQLSINSSASPADFQKSVKGAVLDEATLTATYQREKK